VLEKDKDHSGQLELRIFVYGTLKQGHANHDPYMTGYRSISPARVFGRLYLTPHGFPALEIPLSNIITTGTNNSQRDLEIQMRFSSSRAADRPVPEPEPPGLVRGELYSFEDPGILPRLDRLEDFNPGGQSLYLRVLAPAYAPPGALPAWMYVVSKPESGYDPIENGRWP